jgi:hypothetical protein
VDHWIALMKRPPKPAGPPSPPKPGISMDQLPGECKAVLASGGGPSIGAADAADKPVEKPKAPVPKKSAEKK